MNFIPVILALLVGSASPSLAQTAGGASGGGSTTSGAAAAGSAATGSTGYVGGTLSTGHTISGTAGAADPTPGNALNQGATGDAGASSVTQPSTSHDNAVDTPAAKDATNKLSDTATGILKK